MPLDTNPTGLGPNGLAALAYAMYGIPVFPVRPDKKPHIPDNLRQATDDLATVERWWTKWPDAIIGAPTGKGLGAVVLDLDVKDGRDGVAALCEQEAKHGPVPDCPVRLGNGGKQLFLKCPDGVRIKNVANQIAPGIDVRGCQADGSSAGFVILPPSLRPGKAAYHWGGDSEERFKRKEFPEIPRAWLFLMVFNARERATLETLDIVGADGFGDAPPQEWQATFAGHLRDRQLAQVAARERPPRTPSDRAASVLAADGALSSTGLSRLGTYVARGIENEIGPIASIAPGSQELTINNAALKINSLLMGAEVLGLDVGELRAASLRGYTAAVCSMTATREPWTEADAIAKWEQTAEAASPRDIGHVLSDRGSSNDTAFDGIDGLPDAATTGELSSGERARSFRDRIRPLSLTYEGMAQIPPRKWLADRKFMRKKLSLLVAPGAAGKSLLTVQWAIALALGDGRQFGLNVRERVRVLLVNLEDEYDEIQRRVAAVCMRFGIDPTMLDSWLMTYDARDHDPKLDGFKGVKRTKGELEIAGLKEMAHFAIEANIGAIIVDPLTETHEAKESDNDEMKFVMAAYRWVAEQADAAVLLVHHTRKPSEANSTGHAGSIDASRGASSLANGVRVGMTLFAMSEKDAGSLGIPATDRPSYVRLDDSAKANLSRKSAIAEWYRWESVVLPNTDDMGVLVPVNLDPRENDGDLWEKARAFIVERADAEKPVAISTRGTHGVGYQLNARYPDLASKMKWEEMVDRLAASGEIEHGENSRHKPVWLPIRPDEPNTQSGQ